MESDETQVYLLLNIQQIVAFRGLKILIRNLFSCLFLILMKCEKGAYWPAIINKELSSV